MSVSENVMTNNKKEDDGIRMRLSRLCLRHQFGDMFFGLGSVTSAKFQGKKNKNKNKTLVSRKER